MVNRKFEIQWGGSEFIFFLGGGGTWTTVWTERGLLRDVKYRYLSFSFEGLFYACRLVKHNVRIKILMF